MKKKPILEIVVSLFSLVVVIALFLQVPLGNNEGFSSQLVTTYTFAAMGVLAVAIGVIMRHEYLQAVARPHDKVFYGGFFYWALPLAVFLIAMPWVLSGTYNGSDMGTLGSVGMMSVLVLAGTLGGLLVVAIGWAPFEVTARGIGKLFTTRGKDGYFQLTLGLYCLICLAAIVFGFFSATTVKVGIQGEGQLISALLGLPGDYTLKNPALLNVTRLLFILMIALPFIYEGISKSKRWKDSAIIKNIDEGLKKL